MSQITEVQTRCDHCGDECVEELIVHEEKHFCCHGCKAVYELLDTANLTTYYQGADLKTHKISDQRQIDRKFGFLDNEKIVDQLLKYRNDQIAVVRFDLPSIHCSSCIYLLENLTRINPHVIEARVNFLKKEVTITYEHSELTLKQLVTLLSGIGYEPSISLDTTSGNQVKIKNNLGIKIAVAGFCFGNSMLISLPEYLDSGFQLTESFKGLFGWINLALMLPVLFFASTGYFSSAWKGLKNGFLNIDVPIALGIITLAIRSTVEILWGLGPGYIDSLTGLVFFLLIGKWYQDKTYQALSFERDYKSYFPMAASVVKNSGEESVMLNDLKPKDLLLIHNQELIPADAILVEGNASLDYSFISGESDLVVGNEGDKLYAGGRQFGGPIKVELIKSVDNSELIQMWNRENNNKTDTSYQSLVDRVSKYFTLAIIMISLIAGVFWTFNDPGKIWNTVTAILIVACPCALALALPFSYGHGIRVLGRHGLYLKNSTVIEKLSKIRSIVFDKTGTLTRNVAGQIQFIGAQLTVAQLSMIKTISRNSAHPLSKLIYDSIAYMGPAEKLDSFEETTGKGISAKIANNSIRLGSAEWLLVKGQKGLAGETRVYVELNGEVAGYYRIQSAYRSGIFIVLERLKSYFQLILLSGDNSKERDTLKPYFEQLHFNQKPEQKLSFVKELDSQTLMVGDGLNDAGALQAASVGFAVSEDIHQFSPSCDGILAAEKIKEIPQMINFTQKVRIVLIIAFIISFLYNLVGLSFAVTGNLSPIISAIIMPISSVTVVGFITLTVSFLGKTLFPESIKFKYP